MLFNSLLFGAFFCLVLAVHQLRAPWWLRKLNLVIASYAFYAAWNPPFVVLLAASTVLDWLVARRLASTERQSLRGLLLSISLSMNLGLLATFKYADFLLSVSSDLVGLAGMAWTAPKLGLVLPVGISFYTFQSMSYTIDVYRRQLSPTRSLLDFALFVGFFPQLVAGPIVRASEFLPQCQVPRQTTGDALAWGLVLLVIGLFQKVVLADTLLAPASDALFAAREFATADAWIGSLAFSGQIFCDFSGYSLCAIGVAGTLGFRLPDNFRAPYAALGFSDFWRRWHISLSTWLRDYLYVPLGGNRRGQLKTLRNLMATMLLGGLWHGAAWNFVIWGGLHGLFLVVERRARRLIHDRVALRRVTRILVMLATFTLTTYAWVWFRAPNATVASEISLAMFGAGTSRTALLDGFVRTSVVIVMSGLLATHFWTRDRSIAEVVMATPRPLRVIGLALMLVLVVMVRGNDQAFIYFQF